MSTMTFVCAAAMALTLVAPVAAFAENQIVPSFVDDTGVTHYGYFSKGSQVDAGLRPSIRQSTLALARGRAAIVTDASDGTSYTLGMETPHLYNPEAILIREGGNVW